MVNQISPVHKFSLLFLEIILVSITSVWLPMAFGFIISLRISPVQNFAYIYHLSLLLFASLILIQVISPSGRHFVAEICWFIRMFFCLKLTSCSRVLLEKLKVSHLVKKFPKFYGTQMFITAFTSACQLSLSWASSINSIPPHPTSWRFVLILSSHLRLCLPSDLLPSGFPTKTLYIRLSPPRLLVS